MLDDRGKADADTLRVEGEPKSSARILAALSKARDHFNDWQGTCDHIDEVYARNEAPESQYEWSDPDYDLFWSSSEILKPAIYARPPRPVVAPMFNDRRPLYVTTADLLERSVISAYERGGIDEALLGVRDDLIFYNRGQLWATYDSDDGQRVCIEHLDRKDFLHPPARKWSEVPWAARCAWMSRDEMRSRFAKHSGDAYKDAVVPAGLSPDDEHEGRIPVWEVWHKADRRVYWVAEGVQVMLDEGKPHYDLQGFFPCPRPAYGTLRPRTLLPVPDYRRYAGHFRQINRLTKRIYELLDRVRMRGLVAGGGDLGEAIEQLLAEDDSSTLLIPVPGALISGSSAAAFVQWLPIAEIAAAIQGLVEARRELFADFDRLSGISDIMRGETEASETLGAQRLKGQYGSVRVREKTDEVVRISRDVTRIAAEIMAEHFSRETLLDMAQMEIPKKSEVEAEIRDIEREAAEELKGLAAGLLQAPEDPQAAQQQLQEAQQQLQEAQQQVLGKYGPLLKAASEQVPVEDVMQLLRDHRARNFAFEIETDSTILTDESEAKASSSEFYQAFTSGMQGLIGAASMGPEVMRASAEVLKYTLSPYRPPRSVLAAIDDMLEASPQIAERMAAEDGDPEGVAALAEAEMAKAQAQTMKVEADAQLKLQEIQLRAQEAQAKTAADQQRFALEVEDTQGKIAKTHADIERIHAEIMLAQQKLGLDAHREQREDVKVSADIEMRAQDQALAARQQVASEVQAARGGQP